MTKIQHLLILSCGWTSVIFSELFCTLNFFLKRHEKMWGQVSGDLSASTNFPLISYVTLSQSLKSFKIFVSSSENSSQYFIPQGGVFLRNK